MNLLAVDHRRLFERLVVPHDADLYARIVALKWLVFDALPQTRPKTGLLIDEQYGAALALAARRRGVPLAMPVERNEAAVFTREYGSRFAEHVDAFQPDFVKVLFRYEPAARGFQQSLADLAALRAWCRERKLLLELVPQGGRAELLAAEIAHLAELGVRPDGWKIPVPAGPDVGSTIAALRAASGPTAELLALGGGGPLDDVIATLSTVVGPGAFTGWAVGRAVWQEPLTAHVSGRCSASDATAAIRANLQRLIAATTPVAAR